MPVQLSRSSVQKLTHESPEIRLRTLQQIDAKVMRALAHNEEIEFKPGELFKQLIRWFGMQPLQKREQVLRLMLELLRSSYGPKVYDQMGLERCQRELGKVKQFLRGGQSAELMLVEDLLQQCSDYRLQQQAAVADITELTEAISISHTEETAEGSIRAGSAALECPQEDYEFPWSKATTADYNSMKFVADMLISPKATCEELSNTLQHLHVTMIDYPAEYLLQAPHIFLNLLHLYERHVQTECPLEDVLHALHVFIQLLSERIRMRRKSIFYLPPFRGRHEPVLAKTQLKLDKVVLLLLELCVTYLEHYSSAKLRNEMQQIITLQGFCLDICETQGFSVNKKIVIRVARVCKTLKENVAQSEHIIQHRIIYMLQLFLLQRMLILNEAAIAEVTYLNAILQDYAIKSFYPGHYEQLKQLLLAQDNAVFKSTLTDLEMYEQQFSQMIALLKSPAGFNAKSIIERSYDLQPHALEIFGSSQLFNVLFDAISTSLPQLMENGPLREKANNLLLKLLSLTQEKYAATIFNRIAQACKQHFAALMNGAPFANAAGVCHSKLLASQIIGVPLSTSLLLKLTHCSFECTHAQIKKSCEDVLSMLLRSQHLLGNNWSRLLELLLPIMPMLQCCTKSAKITEALLKLLDPDAHHLSFLDVLKCNIRWLFHPNMQLRCECLTRLIYMLQSLDNAAGYVPNIAEVSDLVPNDVCLLSAPRLYKNIFTETAETNFKEQETTLHNLLALLDSRDIEPLIRKTTIMQLNLLCQQWALSESICSCGAYFFALQALENSLSKASNVDYQDSAIPAIGILMKLLCCDAEFRAELADTANVFVLLLRALFLYANDLQARQDTSTCLLMLLFSTFLLVSPPMTGDHESGIAAPALMANLQLPVKLQFLKAQVASPSNSHTLGIFKTAASESSFLRTLIATIFCDGAQKLTNAWLETQKQYDFNIELQLTARDWSLLKATHPVWNLRRFLKAAANATTHTMLMNATQSLKLQLVLNNMEHDAAVSAPWLPDDLALDFIKLLNKYLQLPPGNKLDFLLFEEMLDVCDLCIQCHSSVIIAGIFKPLENDFEHAFIMLLQNDEIPQRLYRKLTQTMQHLIHAREHIACHSINRSGTPQNSASILYTNLFELLFDVSKTLFDKRDLLRVRCLLPLLELLSTMSLDMSDKQLLNYCKRLMNLSIGLKSFTQTGSQWQRNCLQLVCHLSRHMTQPEQNFQLNASFIKYLSGLCGHNDYQVRALAWCLLGISSRFKDQTISGHCQLIDELSYLPGGFMACCLSTLLDYAEVGLVRQLAGNLFAEMLPKSLSYVDAAALLEQHAFYRVCHEALGLCELGVTLPADFDYNSDADLNTCEIVSCFCRIFINMLQMQPSYVTELCEHAVMYRLYELLKLPVGEGLSSQGYLVMCADICQLYAMCYEKNFIFLQRTLCRDQIWIRSFCLLIGKRFDDEEDLVNVLQLLMAVCKDKTGFQQVCEHISQTPEFIVQLFLRSFSVAAINSSLQRCSLSTLSFLLVLSQLEMEYDFLTFADILEKPIQLEHQQQLLTVNHKSQDSARIKSKLPSNRVTAQTSCDKTSSTFDSCGKSASEFIFIELHRIFLHLYPLKACKFETSPSTTKQQICETISVLLKISPHAQSAACNLKLFDKLLQILNTFLEEFNTSCSTFVRRNGENKKLAIIRNFQLLFNIVLNWFASGVTLLSNELQALSFSKILIQIWPWLAHSGDLKLLTLQMCAILSEQSLIVCKQFSSLISSYSNSILQLVLKVVISETQKIKAASSEDFPIISAGLRVVGNCCASSEGRAALMKARVLDIFDSMHPFNIKAPKLKIDIVQSWLQFWELYTRYNECAQARNVNALCALVNKTKEHSETRLLALRILRNMCFADANRTTLINSTDFIYTVNEIICKRIDNAIDDDSTSYEEELTVCVSIWRLISGGVKYVAMIRSSKLAKKMKILQEHLKTKEEVQLNKQAFAKQLYQVLETIHDIFRN